MIEDILKNFYKNIKLFTPKLNQEADKLIECIKQEKENYFFRQKINDLEYLEKFDNFIEFQIDYFITPYTKKQFKKIIYYWNQLNPESAKYYKELYKKIYD